MEDENDLKSTNHIIDDLVDIVSKNGNLLLNVGPKADGTIPEKQQKVLHEIGDWLKVNGEAIYGTRPWVVSGEGNNKSEYGYMTDNKQAEYTSQDIRFTTKGETLYAISLAWSDDRIFIHSLAKKADPDRKITSVSMLGSDEMLEWKHTEEGLEVKYPTRKPSNFAHVLKIE